MHLHLASENTLRNTVKRPKHSTSETKRWSEMARYMKNHKTKPSPSTDYNTATSENNKDQGFFTKITQVPGGEEREKSYTKKIEQTVE